MDAELRHGYALADIDKLALNVARWGFWQNGSMDFHERRELAWSVIVECLYASDEAPSRHELVDAAQRVIGEQVDAECNARGIDRRSGYIAMPRFWQFWYQAGPAHGPEERVVDRVALAQIWAELVPMHQEVLLALAAHGDHSRAARSLSITMSAYRARLHKARLAFYALWHEGEQPSRIWARDYWGSRGVHSQSRATGIIQRRKRERQTQGGSQSLSGRGLRNERSSAVHTA